MFIDVLLCSTFWKCFGGFYGRKIKNNFEAANKKCFDIISDYVLKGYINNLAKLLVYVGEKGSEEILGKVPENLRGNLKEAYKELADKKNSDPEILCAAGQVFKEAGFYGKEMSDFVSKDLSSGELECLSEINPLLIMNLEQNNISFSSIVDIDDRSIQKILREVDQIVLSKALKNVDPEVQDKIFRNMSKRAAAMIQEDMEYMGPVRISDIYAAQDEILSIIRRLSKDGEIVLSKNDVLF